MRERKGMSNQTKEGSEIPKSERVLRHRPRSTRPGVSARPLPVRLQRTVVDSARGWNNVDESYLRRANWPPGRCGSSSDVRPLPAYGAPPPSPFGSGVYSKGDRIVYEPVRDLQKRPSQPKHVRVIKPNQVLERQTSFSTTRGGGF